MTPERKCENCQFWQRDREGSPHGECRIRAPVVRLGEGGLVISDFPSVEATQWCGEFQAREDAPT